MERRAAGIVHLLFPLPCAVILAPSLFLNLVWTKASRVYATLTAALRPPSSQR